MLTAADPLLDIAFTATIIEWRGPAPFYFAAIPEEHVGAVRYAAHEASYGWGCVPAEVQIGGVAFSTSLFPRDGGYLVPLKAAVRARAGVALGDAIALRLRIARP